MPIAATHDPYSCLDSSGNLLVLCQRCHDAVDAVFDVLPDWKALAQLRIDLHEHLCRLERKVERIGRDQVQRDHNATKAGRRGFVLGLLISIPLGLLGSYLAYLLGIN